MMNFRDICENPSNWTSLLSGVQWLVCCVLNKTTIDDDDESAKKKNNQRANKRNEMKNDRDDDDEHSRAKSSEKEWNTAAKASRNVSAAQGSDGGLLGSRM